MIKQIQLRGISRTPSDRATEDGGCAESLNFHIADGESVPTLPPRDVTPEGLAESGLKVLYIHKGTGYANYIGTIEDDLWCFGEQNPIAELPADIVSITSIGNLLVCSLADGTSQYALFRDGEYKDLGDHVPAPVVTFATTPKQTEEIIGFEFVRLDRADLYDRIKDLTTTAEVWNQIRSLAGDATSRTGNAYQQAADVVNNINTNLWNAIDAEVVKNREDGYFSAPLLACYALRLYDGSYIYPSSPILLAGDTENMSIAEATMAFCNRTTGLEELGYYAHLNHVFKASVDIQLDNPGEWKDLIESVDIFVSTNINTPKQYAKLGNAVAEGTPAVVPQEVTDRNVIKGYALLNYESLERATESGGTVSVNESTSREAFETEMLEKGNFYLLKSFPLDKLPAQEDLEPISQDDLVVKRTLPMSDAHIVSAAGQLSAYNNRLLSTEQRVLLSAGHPEPQALVGVDSGVAMTYALFYHVRDESGAEHLVCGFTDKPFDSSRMRAYVSYPDPRCYQADLYLYDTQTGKYSTLTTLPMKEHPRLNCSYGFWGLDKRLMLTGSLARDSRSYQTNTSEALPGQDNVFMVRNRLALSDTDNPFSYPIAQRVTFQSEIIAALPITIPLSAYQFGHHDIFVFTKDGIWTVTLNDEGGAASSHPFSRDVAFPGTPAQLDQAIAFVSEQGVMILTEGGATNISPNMNGRHYVLDTSVADVIAESEWASLLPAADSAPFMAFARECEIAYDYAGRRILLFNRSRNYQYVYMFDSQTWHKISGALPQFRILNSYPDCLVSTYDSEDEAAILDFSTVLDDADLLSDETNPVLGMIVTRAQDLGAPDVRKVVRDIRIRGHFNRGDVKYMMLGSFDGKTWKRLLTKGGGSYNLFRFVILAKLSPTERISWIDVDCETRFANKLR